MNRHSHSSRTVAVGMSAVLSFAVVMAAGAQTPGGTNPGAQTPQRPLWAYPAPAPGFQPPKDDGSLKQPPGTAKSLTMTEINDPFGPPDWYPDDHPAMPEVVARGKRPDVRACAQCHLPNGHGHPESASLAGLPAPYVVQQMHDFRSGARKNTPIMTAIAKGMTEDEIKASAEYFAGLKMHKWDTVKETKTVPTTFVGSGNMRFASPEGGTEPVGVRIIVVPEDAERAELRDSHSGFVDYVPVGSIKAGAAMVTTGGNKTTRCAICHGADLKGIGPVPGIAGRSPIYIVRQLSNMQDSSRAGVWTDLMKAPVAKLTLEDMVNIAAYVSSLAP